MMKTFSLKAADIKKNWVVIDAENVILGRLAAYVAGQLRGKHKPVFTPHMDCGDHVIIINAEKIALSGGKAANKIYYRHTGYPGGIKSRRAGEMLAGQYPERVLMSAVKRMMPKNTLSAKQLKHLHIYAGQTHPHEAQQPIKIDFAARNKRNRLAADHAN